MLPGKRIRGMLWLGDSLIAQTYDGIFINGERRCPLLAFGDGNLVVHDDSLFAFGMELAVLPPWALIAYLASGVLFILALRGLSSPSTSRAGNRYGMAGMGIAALTTLVTQAPIPEGHWWPQPTQADLVTLFKILAAIALGGGIGWVIARRIQMTAMPQLVAAFHSLVGLAAVAVGWAAYLNPEAFGILGADGLINPVSRVEAGLF